MPLTKDYQFQHKMYDQVIITIITYTESLAWKLLPDVVLDSEAWELVN
jgi:hypothetical protein